MGRNISIYLDDITEARLAQYEQRGGERSAVIRRNLALYSEIMRRSQPDLTAPEWGAIADAWVDEHEPVIQTVLWASVADSAGLGDKWSIDQDAFVVKLRGLPFAAAVAAWDRVARYRAAVGRGESPEQLS